MKYKKQYQENPGKSISLKNGKKTGGEKINTID